MRFVRYFKYMSLTGRSLASLDFEDPRLLAELDFAFNEPALFDDLDFGLVVMDDEGIVLAYNRLEAAYSGISPERCIGRNFFSDVAPCTNNYLVAGRFEDEANLDESLDYVFTLKMRPTRVRLRLLKAAASAQQYIAIRRR